MSSCLVRYPRAFLRLCCSTDRILCSERPQALYPKSDVESVADTLSSRIVLVIISFIKMVVRTSKALGPSCF